VTVARRRGREVCGGLTLVEVLVVVVILTFLAALLVPVGTRAMDEADLVQCRANLRALGVAVLLYAKDSNGALPVSEVMDGPHAELIAALGPYVGDPRVYYCPSEVAPKRVYSDANLRAGRIGYFYYSCEQAPTNRLLSTFLRWNVVWPRRLDSSMHSRTWVASDAWFSGEPTSHRFCKKGVNYLTLGGDVQFISDSPREAFW
jgi:type II secretory pathway pseudopilin PulG